eukprot:1379876-Prymnesium_polylepis.2
MRAEGALRGRALAAAHARCLGELVVAALDGVIAAAERPAAALQPQRRVVTAVRHAMHAPCARRLLEQSTRARSLGGCHDIWLNA